MKTSLRQHATVLIAGASLIAAACGGHDKSGASNGDVATPANGGYTTPTTTPTATVPADTTTEGHHSKLAGAAVGAVAGHVLGGHAALGAAAGALVQHERNKHR